MYSTSTPTPASRHAFAVARISAAGRLQAARQAREAADQAAWAVARETGQLVTPEQDWCFVCGRATDHTGEHEPQDIGGWKMDNFIARALEDSPL